MRTRAKKIHAFIFGLALLNMALSSANIAAAQSSQTTQEYKGVQQQIEEFLCAPSPKQEASTGFSGSGFLSGGAASDAQSYAAGSNNQASSDLYRCINRIYKFAIVLSASVGVLFIVVAGYLYMTAEGNKEAVDKAKGILASTVAGFLILMISYVLLRAINPDLVKFSNIQPPSVRVDKIQPPQPNEYISEGSGGGDKKVIATAGTCPGCVDFTKSGIELSVKGGLIAGSNTFLQEPLVKKLVTLKQKYPSGWHVTEAYPPTVDHSSACHFNGGCADIALKAKSATELNKLCQAVKDAGLRMLNEYTDYQASSIPACPTPKAYKTTTGGHLHVYE